MDMDPPPQARVIPNGEPIEGGEHLYEGSVDGARAFIASLAADQRAEVSIWTHGHVFSADELDATPPGTEHDPEVRRRS